MKAIAITPHTQKIEYADWPEPKIETPTQVKMAVLQVGICGTDREEVAGGRADPPAGEKRLVIGHEMVGRVVEVGAKVKKVKVGDLAVFMVRRPCPSCEPCRKGSADFCQTGRYKERGIKELHGFQAEFAVDEEAYLIPVPSTLAKLAVLTEPTTVVEKAIDHASRVQAARLPEGPFKGGDAWGWLQGKKVLIAGLGPIGLLAAMVLALRGARLFGLDRAEPGSLRPKLLEELGGQYLQGGKGPLPSDFDLIVEAAGVAELDLELFQALGINGAYVLTGVPGGDRPLPFPAASLMRQLVLKNQLLLGSVNAGRCHFEQAVRDLESARIRWPGCIEKFITSQTEAPHFQEEFGKKRPGEIKATIVWHR